MNAHDSFTPDVQKQQDRRRKRKAILAGGVVLGLGAAVTLAAWSDDVFAEGFFGTGTFELQGNVYNDAGYQDYDPAGTGADSGNLGFQIAPLNMAPGDTVYAPISIATSTDTTTGAEVTLAAATSAAVDKTLFNALRYSVASTATPNACDAGAFTDEPELLVPTNSNLATAGTASFTVGAKQANPEHLCFAVTLPEFSDNGADGMQGLTTGPVVWQFSGESLPAEPAG